MKHKWEKMRQFITKHDELFFVIIFFVIFLGKILFVHRA